MSIKFKKYTNMQKEDLASDAQYLILCGIFRKNNGHFTET